VYYASRPLARRRGEPTSSAARGSGIADHVYLHHEVLRTTMAFRADQGK
jgi:hypothetical protein